MTDEHRGVQWRQGELLVHDDSLYLLVSHDCDICADAEIEPEVELIPCAIDVKENGSLTLGKNPRRLQIECFKPGDGFGRRIEIRARDRYALAKQEFFDRAQRYDWQVLPAQKIVIRRWLSARYSRSAFPNAFEDHMRSVSEAIDNLSKKQGAGVRALYFDLDDGEMIERNDPADPYSLAIYVVYPPDTDDKVAHDFAKNLASIFDRSFKRGDEWSKVQLVSCDAVSEDAYTLAMHNNTKTWRVDHRSVGGVMGSEIGPEPDR